MVRIPDNREAESRKSPEYQGKTAQKLAQYGLKAARRALHSAGAECPSIPRILRPMAAMAVTGRFVCSHVLGRGWHSFG